MSSVGKKSDTMIKCLVGNLIVGENSVGIYVLEA